ncbi:histone deacetylase [archaeon]|nr:histone deacetylase [archaeon]
MQLIYSKAFLGHDTGSNPENKERLKYFTHLPDSRIEYDEKALELVHSKAHIEDVRKACEKNAAIKASEKNAFALVRPPGHHASRNRSAGSCLFNNVAVACQHKLNQGKRIAILDFDLHFGDGTQDIFLGEKNIIYVSLHQSPCYPGTGLVSSRNCFNFPLPSGCTDLTYIKALEKAEKIIKEFNPDLVACSAGFDCYHLDFEALGRGNGFKLSRKSLERIKDILKPFRHFMVLEGGYNPESVKEGVGVFIKES